MSELKSLEDWKKRVLDISNKRTWKEIIEHFTKHLTEMSNLDYADEPYRGEKKAYSLVNLCFIAMQKMTGVYDVDDLLENFSYSKLLERFDEHEIYLVEKSKRDASKTMMTRIEKDDDTD